LKVGRVKFAVKEIKYKEKMEVDQTSILPVGDIQKAGEDFEEYEEVESIIDGKGEDDQSTPCDEQETPRCRFCWSTGADPTNPLFSSCKCSGSVGYIHFTCLKSWLDVKKQCKVSPQFSSFYWKAFECEICKKAYPLQIRTHGKTYNLVEYEKPDDDFLALESLNQEKNTSRIIHIIRPNDKKDSFKFGRGHESDLRINDISVSRCHAIIKFKDNKF
jgi:RING-variant domain/FHA domain